MQLTSNCGPWRTLTASCSRFHSAPHSVIIRLFYHFIIFNLIMDCYKCECLSTGVAYVLWKLAVRKLKELKYRPVVKRLRFRGNDAEVNFPLIKLWWTLPKLTKMVIQILNIFNWTKLSKKTYPEFHSEVKSCYMTITKCVMIIIYTEFIKLDRFSQ